MLTLSSLGEQIARRRRTLGLTQDELARKARISRVTVVGLENGYAGELGFSKVARILSVLGLELKVQDASSRRPTLDDLLAEDTDDQNLDRRR